MMTVVYLLEPEEREEEPPLLRPAELLLRPEDPLLRMEDPLLRLGELDL
jgi:hypothetical protein